MATPRASTAQQSNDALQILTADHARVKKMFKEFESLIEDEANEEAEQLAKQICTELTVHAMLEEEIFYPEVRKAIDDEDLIDEAEVEHQTVKDLIAQIESMNSPDEKFSAKVTVLGEYVDHHVQEEQDEMFPKAKQAKMDLAGLGERLLARKQELMAEMGMGEEDEEADEEAQKSKPRGGGSRSVQGSRA